MISSVAAWALDWDGGCACLVPPPPAPKSLGNPAHPASLLLTRGLHCRRVAHPLRFRFVLPCLAQWIDPWLRPSVHAEVEWRWRWVASVRACCRAPAAPTPPCRHAELPQPHAPLPRHWRQRTNRISGESDPLTPSRPALTTRRSESAGPAKGTVASKPHHARISQLGHPQRAHQPVLLADDLRIRSRTGALRHRRPALVVDVVLPLQIQTKVMREKKSTEGAAMQGARVVIAAGSPWIELEVVGSGTEAAARCSSPSDPRPKPPLEVRRRRMESCRGG